MNEGERQKELENAEWCCNGSEIFQDGCKGGISDWGLHLEFDAWRCFHNQAQDDGDDNDD